MANDVASQRRSARVGSLIKKYRRAFLGEFTEAVLAAVLVAVVLRVFFVAVYRVPTDSMAPTLIPGDFILGWKTSYGVRLPLIDATWGGRLPERGDVVAFRIPGDSALYVKRVIALPGDRVSVENGKVSVNEAGVTSDPIEIGSLPEAARIGLQALSGLENLDVQLEARAQPREGGSPSTHVVIRRKDAIEADFLAPLIVPPGEVFLMGDFRSESVDSRQWGAIPASAIESRIAWVALSLHTRKNASESTSLPASSLPASSMSASQVLPLPAEEALQPVGKFRWNRLFHRVR